jgi:hypothetical protein
MAIRMADPPGRGRHERPHDRFDTTAPISFWAAAESCAALVDTSVLMGLDPLRVPSPVVAVALASLTLVMAGHVVAYRRHDSRTWHPVPDLLAITSLTVADGAEAIAAGVLFPGLLYRSVIDPGRAGLPPGLPYLAAVAGLVLVGAPGQLEASGIFTLPAIVVVAGIGRLLVGSCSGARRRGERERTLMEASAPGPRSGLPRTCRRLRGAVRVVAARSAPGRRRDGHETASARPTAACPSSAWW